MTLSTTDKQNASSRQLFPVQISSWHCQNLKKTFFKFTSACLLNRLQILLSFAINFCRNFAVRTSIWQVIGRKWKSVWQSLTTATDPDRSNFINERLTANSSDRLSHASKGHDSTTLARTWHETNLEPPFQKQTVPTLLKNCIKGLEKLTPWMINRTLAHSPANRIHAEVRDNHCINSLWTSNNPWEYRSNYSATSNNMKLAHWPLMGGLLHLVQRGGDWAGPQPTQAPPRCTKCNGQCTNHRIAV